MRWKEIFINTLREEPRDAEAPSHSLMLRAAFIKKLSAGIYAYLPLGFRSLQKVINILRDEMNRAGASELIMPALHPAEIWKSSGRYDTLGEDKFAFKNRSGMEYVLGPTHEEVITQIVAESVKSYKDLPLMLYQIQGKFRDEARPRFGIIRSKEFLMKDAYSFDEDEERLDVNYQKMHKAYLNFFKRSGLEIIPVSADPGLMGGKVSHEFMVKTPYGEDKIVICKNCSYQASLEIAESFIPESDVPQEKEGDIEAISTPGITTIDNLSKTLKIKASKFLKAILYKTEKGPVMVCLRGDHDVNEAKLKRLLSAAHLEMASAEEIEKLTECPIGFLGPSGTKNIDIILDLAAGKEKNWVTGANEKDKHLRNVNINRDFKPALIGDIRYATAEDRCPKCQSSVTIENAMELGHIFKLGIRYSQAPKAQYLSREGKKKDIIMGCYGIGVNRVLAAAIEQSHDEKGMIWPKPLAPFDIEILLLNEKDQTNIDVANDLEESLEKAGFQVLMDDREERAGVKFNDADLIGIPLQVVVSPRNLKEDCVEVKVRKTGETTKVDLSSAIPKIKGIYEKI